MSFSAFNANEIAAGEPNKQELWQKLKDNFDDHETRIEAIETGAITTFLDLEYSVGGDYSIVGAATGLCYQRMSVDITILAGRLFILTAGSAGTTEIDILFKRGAGAWTSIFSTKPSVAFGAGSLAVSSNGVLNPSNVNLQVGDFVRLDITSVQTNGIGLIGLLSIEKT